MQNEDPQSISRRSFAAAAAAFMIVPRHVLGGQGHTAPSDRMTVASIGMGRQGQVVTRELLARSDVQVIAVCDCNKGSKNYIEYSANALMNSSRELLGSGYEHWAPDLESPGVVRFTQTFSSSLGMGGLEPAKRLVDAYYESRNKSGASRTNACAAYSDYRELLDRQQGLDAVYIATPDHWHASIAIAAMRKHKNVLCQKPMAHSIADARRMAKTAADMKVTTSVMVSNPYMESAVTVQKWIDDGSIGAVREVHNWTNRPFWPQGVDRPATAEPVPAGLDWDMWLGPAPERPYNSAYLPFVWRGWFDFGCGSFGDMGCYSFSAIHKILRLTTPIAVETSTPEVFPEAYPKASLVHLDYPAHGERAAVRLSWYDGGLLPERIRGLRADDEPLFQRGGEAVMYVGDRGTILARFNGDAPHLYVDGKVTREAPEEKLDEMHFPSTMKWVEACRAGAKPLADFATEAPVSESFLLGCLSQRMPFQRFEWDAEAMRVTNSEAANALVDPPARGKYGVS